MSQNKHIKKLKQMARREMRKDVSELMTEFKGELFNNPPINKKPKWIPTKIWRRIVTMVVNKEFFEKWYGVKF